MISPILYRRAEGSEIAEFDISGFRTMISKGSVPPTALVCDDILTRGGWWTADNLRVFHELSPTDYPPGELLILRRTREAKEKECQTQALADLEAYMNGALIAERYGLRTLEDLYAEGSCIGVSHLYILSSFAPETIFTVGFDDEHLRIDVVTGATQLWAELAAQLWGKQLTDEDIPPFDTNRIRTAGATLPKKRAPRFFRDWARFSNAARAAGECESTVLDGTSYQHHAVGRGLLIRYRWSNPDARERPQTRLLKAYLKCFSRCGLGSFFAHLVD